MCIASLVAKVRAFKSANKGLAALEFAIIMPIIIVFMLGGVELARFIYISRSIGNLAYSLATRVAERTTTYNFNDAVFDYYSAVVTSPFLLGDAASKGTAWNYDVALTVSSLVFTPTVAGCTSSCTYNAKVAWSVNSPIAAQRSCTTTPTPASDTQAPSMTTLPQDIYTSGSVIAADVVYNYTPVIGARFIPAITIRRSYFMQPRYQFPLTYTSQGFDNAYVCS